MTKEQKMELVKEVVPNMVIKSVRDNNRFNKQDEDYVKSFDGDIFQECAQNSENDIYRLMEEESFGGYEGDGEDTWVIYCLINKKSDEKIYFKIHGWYNSWDGTEWNDEITIVQPKEVIKIEWKEI